MATTESKAGTSFYGLPGAIRPQMRVESKNDPLWIARQIREAKLRAGRFSDPHPEIIEEEEMETPACMKTSAQVMHWGFWGGIAGGGAAGYYLAPNHRVIGTVAGVAVGLVAWFFGSAAVISSCAKDNPEWVESQLEEREGMSGPVRLAPRRFVRY